MQTPPKGHRHHTTPAPKSSIPLSRVQTPRMKAERAQFCEFTFGPQHTMRCIIFFPLIYVEQYTRGRFHCHPLRFAGLFSFPIAPCDADCSLQFVFCRPWRDAESLIVRFVAARTWRCLEKTTPHAVFTCIDVNYKRIRAVSGTFEIRHEELHSMRNMIFYICKCLLSLLGPEFCPLAVG